MDAKSIVEKMIEDKVQSKQTQAINKEKLDDYIKALNGVASTPNGQLVLQTLIESTGIFRVDSSHNASKLVEDNGMRKVYLQLIRPYLEPELRKQVE